MSSLKRKSVEDVDPPTPRASDLSEGRDGPDESISTPRTYHAANNDLLKAVGEDHVDGTSEVLAVEAAELGKPIPIETNHEIRETLKKINKEPDSHHEMMLKMAFWAESHHNPNVQRHRHCQAFRECWADNAIKSGAMAPGEDPSCDVDHQGKRMPSLESHNAATL
jgi:hypothetical protein